MKPIESISIETGVFKLTFTGKQVLKAAFLGALVVFLGTYFAFKRNVKTFLPNNQKATA